MLSFLNAAEEAAEESNRVKKRRVGPEWQAPKPKGKGLVRLFTIAAPINCIVKRTDFPE